VDVNLEDQIAENLSKEIAREIDKEILWGMLQGIGWIRVTLPSFVDNNHAVDITYWLEENCKGRVERNGSDFLFERGEDAVIFTLRWMG
jgi:hypothetical protein